MRFWRRGKIGKTFALVCIYGLNLVFFQSLLAAPQSSSTDGFNILVSDTDDSQKSNSNNAVDYYKLFKHSHNTERTSLALPADILSKHFTAELPIVVKQELPFSQWLFYAHLPTDAFKIYKRICVFLI